MKRRLLPFVALFLFLHVDAQEDNVARRPEHPSFRSEAIEQCIDSMKRVIADPKLAAMFEQCFPNTLDTTVRPGKNDDGDDDTFVITGDIPAMWLRDSGAQVWPYVRFAAKDEALRRLIRGVVRRQFRSLLIDPYANAFTYSPDSISPEWADDYTEMRPGVFERKYELDSQCYPLRLAYAYWKATGDSSIFDGLWLRTMRTILSTMRQQQRESGRGEYRFMRSTHAMHDTRSNYGYGHPAKPCGLIASAFRPSDDCNVLPYNVPGNFMAASCLRQAAEILQKVNGETTLADSCLSLSKEIGTALKQHAIVTHPRYGRIYAYEVDGFGSTLLMDDANVPSLLSLPYISDVSATDSIYQNTRRFVWSTDNPYFFRGTAGEGIGGPHVGLDFIWPMSIIMRGLTADNAAERRICLDALLRTDDYTGFMHEAFHKDNPSKYTRSWFAWANTLFGEFVLKIYAEDKPAKAR